MHAQADAGTKLLSATTCSHSYLHFGGHEWDQKKNGESMTFFTTFSLKEKIKNCRLYLFPLKVYIHMVWHPSGCCHDCHSCLRKPIISVTLIWVLYPKISYFHKFPLVRATHSWVWQNSLSFSSSHQRDNQKISQNFS